MIVSIFKLHDHLQDFTPGAPSELLNQSLANFFPLC